MFHHFKINIKMSFLLNLFTRPPPSCPRQALQKTLQHMKIDSDQALPQNYYELLFAVPNHQFSKAEILNEIVAYLGRASSEAAIVKAYTIIMCAIRMSDYEEQCCDALEGLQRVETKGGKDARMLQFEKSCKSYLIKIPSMSQLYRSCLSRRSSDSHPQDHVALFRLMNQFSLLFPCLNTILNTIGRYYKEAYLYYKQFYRVWRSEVLMGYTSMKKIIDDLTNNYRKNDVSITECFLSSVPEIELLCDQMENLITNKYYKGKNPNKKVYFKVEALQEMEYYVIEANGEKGKMEQDFIRTADDDFFSLQ